MLFIGVDVIKFTMPHLTIYIGLVFVQESTRIITKWIYNLLIRLNLGGGAYLCVLWSFV